LPTLDLFGLKANERLAMRTVNRRRAGNGQPQVRIITGVAGFLKCDALRARGVGAPNR
jgi:hypothetical protein